MQKKGEDGRANYFEESASAARAQIVNGASEELLAGAGLAEEEYGGASGSGQLNLSEGALERRTLADDFLKIEFTANFLLEVKFFFGEFILESFDFLESQSVFDGNSDLRVDELQELHILG